MHVPAVKGYSIWLLPDKQTSQQLGQIILRFSEKFLTPTFDPHITLLGQIIESEERIIPRFEALAHSTAPLSVVLGNPEMQDYFFRSLYLNVSPATPLHHLYHQALDTFDLDRDRDAFLPHLSLLYSNQSLEEKQSLVGESALSHEFNSNLEVMKLVKTEGPPHQWKPIRSIQL